MAGAGRVRPGGRSQLRLVAVLPLLQAEIQLRLARHLCQHAGCASRQRLHPSNAVLRDCRSDCGHCVNRAAAAGRLCRHLPGPSHPSHSQRYLQHRGRRLHTTRDSHLRCQRRGAKSSVLGLRSLHCWWNLLRSGRRPRYSRLCRSQTLESSCKGTFLYLDEHTLLTYDTRFERFWSGLIFLNTELYRSKFLCLPLVSQGQRRYHNCALCEV